MSDEKETSTTKVPPPTITDPHGQDHGLIAMTGLAVGPDPRGPNLFLEIDGVNQSYRFLLSLPASARLSKTLSEAMQKYLYGKRPVCPA